MYVPFFIHDLDNDFDFDVLMGQSNILRYLQQLNYDENICNLSI